MNLGAKFIKIGEGEPKFDLNRAFPLVSSH